ncbi:MAG: hypothetical protein KIS85_03820 [Anaerolineales bacterium]|nr:hypothetical protein [Anaerolineales bacterium]
MPIARSPRFLPLLFLAILLAACAGAGPAAPPEPTATPEPAGPGTLNICAPSEPASLYLYADNSQAARSIRQAIYDGPFDSRGHQPQAVILQSVPSLENGGAVLHTVAVSPGSLVVDAGGQVAPLQPGLRIYPAGCRDGDCVIEYSEGEVQMDQLVVTFALKPGLTWADGAPLTATDSVYSFELEADPATPGDKSKIERTASYTAEGERAVWQGLPGYLDPGYQTNFWHPLPRHIWGDTSAADLLTIEASSRRPLGWGPYSVREWTPGQRISLERNPNYFRAAEGLPYFETLNFIFGAFSAADLQNGNCDLLLPADGLADQVGALQAAGAQLHYAPAGRWEQLAFGVRPLDHDDGFNVFQDSANLFGDLRMREAIAMCIDRQALVDQLAFGQGNVLHTYPPADTVSVGYGIPFDPAAGNALLDELGWPHGADGLRTNQFFPGAVPGLPLQLTLAIGDSPMAAAIAGLLRASLDDCGIALDVHSGPAEQVFAPGPEGEVFGRRFQLAQFAWPGTEQPACYLYLSEAIPGPDLGTFKYSWGGWNIAGWADAEYDAVCAAALSRLPGEPGYAEAQALAQNLFAQRIPALPLFVPYQLAAARGDFCGFGAEPGTQLLQEIENYGYAEWCQ